MENDSTMPSPTQPLPPTNTNQTTNQTTTQEDLEQDLTILPLPNPSALHPTAHATWQNLYSTIGPTSPHPSPSTFNTQYTPPHGLFLLASTPSHPIAGTIAYRAYDNRFSHFPELNFQPSDGVVVEVARLYVEPELRGRGVATRLVRRLVEVARGEGVGVLYLHTHPFLAGAEELWVKEGWRVVRREEEGPWWTVHLRRDL